MNKGKYKECKEPEVLLTDVNGLCTMLKVGKGKAMEIAKLAEARVDLSSSKLARFHVEKIRSYIEEHTF